MVQKAAIVLMDEEHSKAEGRGEMSETELLIMDQFTILVRDLYAFYPLLIRFVDYNRYGMAVWIPLHILNACQPHYLCVVTEFSAKSGTLVNVSLVTFNKTFNSSSKQFYREMCLIAFFLRLPWFADRARWLKESNPEAEELFRMAAEIFIFWAKSHVSSCLFYCVRFTNYIYI